MSHQLHPIIDSVERNQVFNKTFVKYHGNGNDFIIFDMIDGAAIEPLEQFALAAKKLCDRYRGIGADGVIFLGRKNGRFLMGVLNADGSVAKNCGNGLRCAAAYLFEKQGSKEVLIEFFNRTFICKKTLDKISVVMGECRVKKADEFYLSSLATCAQMGMADINNQHVIFLFAEKIADFTIALDEIRQKIAIENTNVSFLFEQEENRFISRVHERGVGWTNSCGSGACAQAAFLALLFPRCKNMPITMVQPGGEITVQAFEKSRGIDEAVFSTIQTADAFRVFTGICEASFS